MKKTTKILSLLFIFLSLNSLAQTKVFIPDTNFRNFLIATYPTFMDGDSLITDSAATLTGVLDCDSLNIADLTGVEYFISISELKCSFNLLNNLPDLSQITSLLNLRCDNNQLDSLPSLSNNTALSGLYCHLNQLTNLPALSNNTALRFLYCNFNLLTSLPSLSNNTALEWLICSNNQLDSIPDLSNNSALESLICYNNQLTSLPNLSNNVALKNLQCQNNQLTSLPSLSNNAALIYLYCYVNQLTILPGLSNNTALQYLVCYSNQLTSLPDLSNNTVLRWLHCNDNLLTSLPDLSNDTLIQSLYCFNNQLDSLPGLPNNTTITILYCQNNQLVSLPDFSGNIALQQLRCGNNLLCDLPDLSNNTALQDFECPLNNLDFSDARELRIVDTLPNLTTFIYSPQNAACSQKDTLYFCIGETGVLSIPSQDSALSYQWFRDADTLTGATDTVLTLNNIQLSDTGNYTCRSYGTALNAPPMNFGPGISEFVSEPITVYVGTNYLISGISSSSNVSCTGDSTGSATVTPASGTPPYTYLWDDLNSQTDSIATGLPAGTYTVVVTDSNGCTATDSIIISEPPPNCVATTSDSGCGSLRQAILDANANPGPDTICFAIPGMGPYTIQPLSPLPDITDTLVIDGYTQPGSAVAFANTPAKIMVEIDGSLADTTYGFIFLPGAEKSLIRGLTINRFIEEAIRIEADTVTVQGNHIGTDTLGTVSLANQAGIYIVTSSNSLIGGATPAERNVISGNIIFGILINTSNANYIRGNYIGTNVAGIVPLSNGSDGVRLDIGASNNMIGGPNPGERNIISGNNSTGVFIMGSGTSFNNVVGNYIGTDTTGTISISNGIFGVVMTGGSSGNNIGGGLPGEGNVISGNSTSAGIGVIIGGGSDNNFVRGNKIGTDAAGINPLPNRDGILIENGATNNQIGGGTAGERNTISGNTLNGVIIANPGTGFNLVKGNYIGTDITGTSAVPNNSRGIYIASGASNNIIGGITQGERNIISGNGQDGIGITGSGADSNVVIGNYIGIDVNGSALANSMNGISFYSGARYNVAGGTGPGTGNVISGNAWRGVTIYDGFTAYNRVIGNLIGTDTTGTAALGNGGSGIWIYFGSHDNMIGGPTPNERNVISANGGDGIEIYMGGTYFNNIQGNYIGTDVTGSNSLGNAGDGISIYTNASNNTIGGNSPGEGNLVSGNTGHGISIDGVDSNNVYGNYIGTDAAGAASIANTVHGVFITNGATYNNIGGNLAGEGNLISGNSGNGIFLSNSSYNNVYGNNIGIDLGGTFALPNVHGIYIASNSSDNRIGGDTPAHTNVISGNSQNGISFISAGTNNEVYGNLIGTDPTGTVAIGNALRGLMLYTTNASGNIIGGPSGRGNVISGNGTGINNGSSGFIIQGNLIGTDINGSAPLPNVKGIYVWGDNNTIGGSAAGEGNVISGNSNVGIDIRGNGNVIAGNFIGTDISATVNLGNGLSGITGTDTIMNNIIGDSTAGAGNIITNNGGAGITLDPVAETGNQILSNLIYDNSGLGIDLGNNGVTANDLGDTDTGPNNYQNFPLIDTAIVCNSGAAIVIEGTINSAINTNFRLEFFSSPTADTSGYGEGQYFLGATYVTTDGSGNANYSVSLPVAVPIGYYITSTATDLIDNNTSEFSLAVIVNTLSPPVAGTDTTYCTGASFANMIATSLTGGTISWYSDSILTAFITSGTTLTPFDSTGVTRYYVTQTLAGCESKASVVTITITSPAVNITNSTNVLCTGDSTGSATVTPSSGTSTYTYLWNDPNYQTDSTATGLPADTFMVVVTDTNGCVDSATVIITQPDTALTVSIIDFTNVICGGDSTGSATAAPSGGTPPYTYLWNDPDAQTDSVATGLPANTFTVIVTDTNGCVGSASVIIGENGVPFITTDSVLNISCYGDSNGAVYLTISNGILPYTYLWSSSDTIEDISNLTAGTYILTVTDSAGCYTTDSMAITEPADITISTFTTSATCMGDVDGSAEVNVIGGTPPYAYLWSPSGGNSSIAANLEEGAYIIAVTDSNNCLKNETIVINVIGGPNCEDWKIYSGISPNDDGTDDIWIIDGLDQFKPVKVIIFNRWENIVWESDNYNNDWKGTNAEGKPLPDGVYYYVVITTNDTFKGWVTIIR